MNAMILVATLIAILLVQIVGGLFAREYLVIMLKLPFEHAQENQQFGFRPGPTKTSLYCHRSMIEA